MKGRDLSRRRRKEVGGGEREAEAKAAEASIVTTKF